jgi:hypothetical protein
MNVFMFITSGYFMIIIFIINYISLLEVYFDLEEEEREKNKRQYYKICNNFFIE